MKNLIKQPNNNITVVDLFCGAGIGAVGIKKAGFNIIYAIDNAQYAVDTYNQNIGNHAICKDIKKMDLNTIPYADVFVGGFPCQPFSFGGKGDGQHHKKSGDLGYYFFKAVSIKKPKAFIIENVKGIISKKHQKFFNELIHQFKDIGYNVQWRLIDCYDYGVPQNRERVFIVGIRNDIKKEFHFPPTTPNNEKTNLFDAIGDLPDPTSQHSFKNHKQFYDNGFSPRYLSRNRQRQWNEPSFTICSTARQLPLHPSPENYDIRKRDIQKDKPPRRLTVRECLRIQTVPDTFYFDDSIPFEKQHIRCSGIPSLIAYKLFNELKNTLL